MSPSKDGTELDASEQAPGGPLEVAPERLEKFAPGLSTELMELIQKTAEMEMAEIDATSKRRSSAAPYPRGRVLQVQ
ncbi:hypothetical protein O4220_15375 [Rhodococcus ruber]|uniref:Transposase n=1 Tax=Rhodococcus ruber TaxID=1830 RepID=A0ABT4MFY0_9NOCA|nr:hypothetical protein [Rhodococcus ruber]MCZ4519894.1 hypothetical protein [Rhodococcus ruber]